MRETFTSFNTIENICGDKLGLLTSLWFFTNIGLYLASRNVQPVDNFWNGM